MDLCRVRAVSLRSFAQVRSSCGKDSGRKRRGTISLRQARRCRPTRAIWHSPDDSGVPLRLHLTSAENTKSAVRPVTPGCDLGHIDSGLQAGQIARNKAVVINGTWTAKRSLAAGKTT